jgi:hypothetical protein
MTVGYALLLRLSATPHWLAVLLPATILVGAGIGFSFPALNVQATAAVAAHEQGLAAALFQTSTQLGAASALAVVTAVVTANGGAATARVTVLHAYRDGLFVVAGLAALGLLLALSAVGSRSKDVEAAVGDLAA